MSTAPVAKNLTGSSGRGRVAGARAAALRPALRLLTPPLARQRRPSFVGVCALLMVACLGALLAINIVLSRGAYTEQKLTLKQAALAETQEALAEKVAHDSAPDVLSQKARDLGMIPNSSPAFVKLSDGTILGVPTPATVAGAPASSDLTQAAAGSQQPAGTDPAAQGAGAADPNAAGTPADAAASTPSASSGSIDSDSAGGNSAASGSASTPSAGASDGAVVVPQSATADSAAPTSAAPDDPATGTLPSATPVTGDDAAQVGAGQ